MDFERGRTAGRRPLDRDALSPEILVLTPFLLVVDDDRTDDALGQILMVGLQLGMRPAYGTARAGRRHGEPNRF